MEVRSKSFTWSWRRDLGTSVGSLGFRHTEGRIALVQQRDSALMRWQVMLMEHVRVNVEASYSQWHVEVGSLSATLARNRHVQKRRSYGRLEGCPRHTCLGADTIKIFASSSHLDASLAINSTLRLSRGIPGTSSLLISPFHRFALPPTAFVSPHTSTRRKREYKTPKHAANGISHSPYVAEQASLAS